MVAGSDLKEELLVLINEALDCCLFDNAVFLAELLHSLAPQYEQHAYLLAMCYHRSNQAYRAYQVLKYSPACNSPESKYLLALCCLDLNRLPEAERALSDDAGGIHGGAYGVYLLGKVQRAMGKSDAAVRLFSQALSMEPALWCAFRDLCHLGGDREAEQHLERLRGIEGGNGGAAVAVAAAVAQHSGFGGQGEGMGGGMFGGEYQGGGNVQRTLNLQTPGGPPPSAQPAAHGPPATPVFGGHPEDPMGPMGGLEGPSPPMSAFGAMHAAPAKGPPQRDMPAAASTPAGPLILPPNFSTPSPFTTPQNAAAIPSAPPPPAYKAAPPPPARLGQAAAPPSAAPDAAGAAPRKFLVEGKMRKVSGRLFEEGQAGGGAGSLAGAQPVWGPNRGPGQGQEPAGPSLRVPREACGLLKLLGDAYRHVCMYRCREALELLRRLPHSLPTHSAWVQSQMGRCHLELVEYSEAVRCFEGARRACPHRLEGCDYHSTALWQLRRDVELSHLAQECLQHDRLGPQAWVALGNCFSLAREHEMAVKVLQRALQLDPNYAYAHTLCGHEYAALEDVERAAACYRQAIRCESRHYNAWYGLGQVFFRQEKYDSAEAQFHKALELNPQSSVLLCYRGMALARQGRAAEARRDLSAAIRLDPRNPLARFERASLLVTTGALQEALEELRSLKGLAPREPSVHFQMGRIMKRLGRREEALRLFNDALDLKPPTADATAIKTAIEKMNMPDDTEDDWK